MKLTFGMALRNQNLTSGYFALVTSDYISDNQAREIKMQEIVNDNMAKPSKATSETNRQTRAERARILNSI